VPISSQSPSVESMIIAVIAFSADILHAFAIARGWEELLLLPDRKASVSDYPDGYLVMLPQVPVAFCSDEQESAWYCCASASKNCVHALFRPPSCDHVWRSSYE
jgi:hypothetical protein